MIHASHLEVGRIRRSLVFQPRGLDLFVSGAMGGETMSTLKTKKIDKTYTQEIKKKQEYKRNSS